MVTTYINIFHPIYNASFFDPFDEGIAGSIVRDS